MMKGRDIVLSIGGREVEGCKVSKVQGGKCDSLSKISVTMEASESNRQALREFIDRISKGSAVDISQGFSMGECKLFEVSND